MSVIYSSYEGNNERSQDINSMLMDKESLSNCDAHIADPDLDLETTTDTYQVKNSNIKPCVVCHLHIVNISSVLNTESSEDDVNSTPVVSPIAENSNTKMENNNNSDYLALQDNRINDNTAQDNLNHQAYTSQAKITETNVASLSNSIKQIRLTNIGIVNTQHYKMALVFAACCIIGCCLMPIILYYVSQTVNNDTTDYEYSHGKNISTEVCYKPVCI